MALSDWASIATIIGGGATFIAAVAATAAAYFAWKSVSAFSTETKMQRRIQIEASIIATYQTYLSDKPAFFDGQAGELVTRARRTLSLGYLVAQMAKRYAAQTAEAGGADEDGIIAAIIDQLEKDLSKFERGLIAWSRRMGYDDDNEEALA